MVVYIQILHECSCFIEFIKRVDFKVWGYFTPRGDVMLRWLIAYANSIEISCTSSYISSHDILV